MRKIVPTLRVYGDTESVHSADACLHQVIVGLVKLLDAVNLAAFPRGAGKAVNLVPVPQCFQNLAQQYQ